MDPSGIIVTNKHVIAGAFRITVTLSDRSQWNGTLIGAAGLIDIAVVKIDVGHPLPYLKFADSDKAEVGDAVILIGNPLGLGTSVTSGIISAVHRSLMNSPIDDYIQTDAALNHGNSGGPMIDTDGNVVGVDTILVTNGAGEGSNGLGFAIASKSAEYVLRHFLNPDSVRIGWIGIHVQDVTPSLQHAFNLPQAAGFLVTDTDNDSPAARAGLKFGDVITRYGDKNSRDGQRVHPGHHRHAAEHNDAGVVHPGWEGHDGECYGHPMAEHGQFRRFNDEQHGNRLCGDSTGSRSHPGADVRRGEVAV